MNERHASLWAGASKNLFRVILWVLVMSAAHASGGAQAQTLLPGSSSGAESAEQKANAVQPDPYGVRTDLNLTHPADLDVTRGWVPAV